MGARDDDGQHTRTEVDYQRELDRLRRMGEGDLCAYVLPPGAIPEPLFPDKSDWIDLNEVGLEVTPATEHGEEE